MSRQTEDDPVAPVADAKTISPDLSMIAISLCFSDATNGGNMYMFNFFKEDDTIRVRVNDTIVFQSGEKKGRPVLTANERVVKSVGTEIRDMIMPLADKAIKLMMMEEQARLAEKEKKGSAVPKKAAKEESAVVAKEEAAKEEPKKAAAAAKEEPAEKPKKAAAAAKEEPVEKPKKGGGKKAAAAVEESSSEEEDAKAPLHQRRKKIPKHIRSLVWNKYIGGDIASTKCMCCREKTIEIASFHCGHVIAEAKGGDMTITNLRPICSNCNLAMGTKSMNEFTSEFFGWKV